MILLIHTNYDELSKYEFLYPVVNIVKKHEEFEIKSYREKIEYEKFDKIIITGTAMKDFDYMNYIENFLWMKNYNGYILGICSGLQIISSVFNIKLKDKTFIGVKRIKINKNKLIDRDIDGYFITSKLPEYSNNMEILGISEGEIVFYKIRDKEIYSLAFHPEVLNREIIEKFIKL